MPKRSKNTENPPLPPTLPAPGVADPVDEADLLVMYRQMLLLRRFEELAAKIKSVGKAGVYIPVNHAACRFTPQDLLAMGVNYSSVAPAPPTIVLNALKASAQNIREEAAMAVKI